MPRGYLHFDLTWASFQCIGQGAPRSNTWAIQAVLSRQEKSAYRCVRHTQKLQQSEMDGNEGNCDLQSNKIAWVILWLITAVSLLSSTWQHKTKLNPQLYSTHLKVATHANENSVKTGWSSTEKLCATGDSMLLIKKKLWNTWNRLTMPKFLDLCQVNSCPLLTVACIYISVEILRIQLFVASLTGRS